MSISPPRYAARSVARVGRGPRTLAVLFREISARAGWGTWLVVGLAYAFILLDVVLTFEFTPPSEVHLSGFFGPMSNPFWSLLVLLVTASTGSEAIAEDLSSRAITLYLSRPIHLEDYLSAKAGGVAFWIAMVAIGPGVVAVILTALLGLVSASLALSAIGAFLAVGLLTTFLCTSLAIGLSTWTGRGLYAGVAIFGIPLSLELAQAAISGATGNAAVRYLGLFTDLQNVGQSVFATHAATSTDPAVTAAGLGAVGVVLVLVTWVRLRRVEVVGE